MSGSKPRKTNEAAHPEADEDQGAAWELVDVGRYMPRRIRGSFRGRELG